MKQGIVRESNKEYHNNKEWVSKTRLSRMAVCPKYFKYYEDNPEPKTDSQVFGSAFHKLVLEPDTFDKEYAIMPKFNLRTNQGKIDQAEFLMNNPDKDCISEEQYATICEMRDTLLQEPYVAKLLKGEHEQSMYGVDEVTGELIKTRPDSYRIIGDRLIIVDLKTCTSAMSDKFSRAVTEYAYDLQAYMYCYNASKLLNIPMENIDFVFIAIEKSQPYLVNITQADEFVLQRGEQLFRQYIGTYHYCKENDNWYGLNGEHGIINNLSLPAYMLKNL